MTRNRVLVIGLDGVGFPLIDPWMADGELPHLQGAIARGVSGKLESTIPPLTGPAWATFQTGVNPGKHGIFGWTKRRGYGVSVVTGRDIACPTIWELASETGRRVVAIGLPLSYPPRKVNGVIIPGMLTPKDDPAPTYPKTAYAEVRSAAPNYRFFPDCAHLPKVKGKVEALIESVRGRSDAAEYFLRKHDWDLLMVHFQATDAAQHDLWGVDDGAPLLDVFREVDRRVGRLLEIAEEMDASVIILSDHGMGPHEYTFSVNTWLLHAGYLKLKRSLPVRIKELAFRLGLTQRRLSRLGLLFYPLAYRLGAVDSFFDAVGEGGLARLISRAFLSLEDIDWEHTKAYSHADVGHIRINRKGREPEGIVGEEEAESLVEELIAGLLEVANPNIEEPLCDTVMRREEVYRGEYVSEAPDILFLPRELRTLASGASGFYSNRLFDRALGRGSHRMEGIITAIGGPFRQGFEMQNARLVDLAANILYLLDCPIPGYMDGEIWSAAFVPGTLTARPPQPSVVGSSAPIRDTELSDTQEAELQRRLKRLGYLD